MCDVTHSSVKITVRYEVSYINICFFTTSASEIIVICAALNSTAKGVLLGKIWHKRFG